MEAKIKTKSFTDDALIERLRKNPKELKKFKNYLISEYKTQVQVAIATLVVVCVSKPHLSVIPCRKPLSC